MEAAGVELRKHFTINALGPIDLAEHRQNRSKSSLQVQNRYSSAVRDIGRNSRLDSYLILRGFTIDLFSRAPASDIVLRRPRGTGSRPFNSMQIASHRSHTVWACSVLNIPPFISTHTIRGPADCPALNSSAFIGKH